MDKDPRTLPRRRGDRRMDNDFVFLECDLVKAVVCEYCGHEQPDMGKGVECEECGEGPMPTEGDE